MTAFVLDASVTMAWCFKDEASDEAWALLDRLIDDTAIVPGIRSAEGANVLLVAESPHGEAICHCGTSEETAAEQDARRGPVDRPRTRLAAYDALYLDLAIRHSAPLATPDLALRTAARKMRVAVLPSIDRWRAVTRSKR